MDGNEDAPESWGRHLNENLGAIDAMRSEDGYYNTNLVRFLEGVALPLRGFGEPD